MKKAISILLALAIVLTCMSMTVFAASSKISATLQTEDDYESGLGSGYIPDNQERLTDDNYKGDSVNVREKLNEYVAEYYTNPYYTPQIDIRNYEELYEHKNADNETDWVMLFALIDWPDPWCGMGFAGNRVLISGTYDIFQFGMGLYVVQEDMFYDLTKMTDYSQYDGLAKAIDAYGKGTLLGDLDSDDELTIIDVTILQRCEAHMSEYPETDTITSDTPIDSSFHPLTYYSDFNRDGERNILDATAIQRYLVGLS